MDKEYAKHHRKEPGLELLHNIVEYGIHHYSFELDQWGFELSDGTNFYSIHRNSTFI